MSTTARHATGRRAARDVLLQIVTRVLNLLLGVLVTALLARTLGTVYYGQWLTILAVLGLVGYLAAFGMEGVVVREAAANPDSEKEWMGAMMLVRLCLVGPVSGLSIIALVLLHHGHQMLIAGVILMLTMPFGGLSVMQLVFQLRVNNLVPMIVLTLRSVLWAAAVVIVYVSHGGMIALAVGMTATNLVGTIYLSVAASRLLRPVPRPSRAKVRQLLTVGIPLGVAGMLVIAYARVDQVIVYSIKGSHDAGLYGSVYNLIDQAHFVPISVLTTLTPMIASAWSVDRGRVLDIIRVAAEMLAIVSLGVLGFTIAAATPFVRAIFGPHFVPAAQALPVLAGAFVFMCFGYLNANLLTIMHRQSALVKISLLGLAFNVAGNFVLVPLDGFMGAAWMTLITEVVVFGCSLRLIAGELGDQLPGSGRLARAVLAAAAMTVAIWGLSRAGASLGELIAAAAAIYPVLLLGFSAVAIDDVRMVLRRRAPA